LRGEKLGAIGEHEKEAIAKEVPMVKEPATALGIGVGK
jgi:hypothetical protein